jgi:hypothetical protein
MQVSALAHIKDVARGIPEKINTRLGGQSIELPFKASLLHGNPLPQEEGEDDDGLG